MPFQEDHGHFLSVPQTRSLSPLSSRYSRHKAEFGACLHTLTLLDIVGWDDALTAHFVFGFVPVGVLGDSHDGEHISFAEGKVLLSSAMEVVLGNTFCTGWPGGLQDKGRVCGYSLGSFSTNLPECP